MAMEEFYVKTDNADKLMDRVWCIRSKDLWVHWYWKDEVEKEKPIMVNKRDCKEGCNYTLTIAIKDDKEVDYPVWPLRFTKDSFKMYPAIDLKCTLIAPIGLPMTPVMFPTDDSRAEFHVDYCEFLGKKFHVHRRSRQYKNFKLLETEHGIRKEWFNMVTLDPEYKVGSAGEPDINPK
ncbi:MAG: hypothetical protein SGBAC_007090 [Bacillariaceae sp.]